MPRRAEVYWVHLDPTAGSEIAKTRPCVVVSNDQINKHRRTVVVIPISSSPTPVRNLMIAVYCNGRDGVAVVDQIRAVAKERLGKRISTLTSVEMADIAEALQDSLSL